MSTDIAAPRVVELVRVSTDMQKEKATHEVQRQALDALRKTRPGMLVRRLEALGVSGAKGLADRADLQELDRLSRAKAYDELRVFSIDRLTRSDDPRERAAIYGMVLDAGAKIVDVNGRVIDPSRDGDLGELDYFLQTLFSARERKKIGARTLAGRKLRASQGKLSQGKAPYGRILNKLSKTWELVGHEVEVYRRIIDACLEGRSTREIAKTLNAARVTPPVRTRWGKSTILRMLKTPAIVGRYEVCGHVTEIPPIATPAEWDRIRAGLKQNVSRRADTKPRFALMRQRLVCAACGMTAHVESDGAGASSRYVCPKPSRREEHPPCPDRRSIRVPVADAAVQAAILELIGDSELILKAVRAARIADDVIEDPKVAVAKLEKELAKLTSREARTLSLLNEGLLSDDLARRELGAIKATRADIGEKRKAILETAAPLPKLQDFIEAADELRSAVKRATPDQVRELLAILVPEKSGCGLRLTRDGIEIHGLFPLASAHRYEAHSSAQADRVPGIPFRLDIAV